ncbi:MAG: proline--tRNA ligase [Acidimicrobiia bacterium]|nr:proline--tRNA ligase [Acidimicrobiia bacterium]
MRWSRAFIPTLREDPAAAEAASHRLLLRGGYIRQLMSGVYSLLPLGTIVHQKVEQIIREEMNAVGAQECILPNLHPREIWEKTGRADLMADILFSFKDRRDGEVVLGVTHEEIFTTVAAELTSYKQLPQVWYQFQTKFRDEPRPRAGLLRVREFTMKDAYTFDVDDAGLDVAFQAMGAAYRRIFRRLGLDAIGVEASSGAMGGKDSTEFMVEAEVGEDVVIHCPSCGYAANVERATSAVSPVADEEGPSEPTPFDTPGVRTIAGLAEFDEPSSADRQIKTMVYFLDDVPTLVLMRGDHAVQEQKLMDTTGTAHARAADGPEVLELLGANPGSLGAVGVSDLRVVADLALQGRTNLTTGANKDDVHLRGVDMARDIAVAEWVDIREVSAGEPCVECGGTLEEKKTIEIGHIFKLGTRYAEILGASVLDANGKPQPITMGSYGIGVGRNVAAIVEAHHDERGIVWPIAVAPYEVVLTVVKVDDEASMTAADTLYSQLREASIDVLLDDRAERPGVKFADAELIGIPYRVTIGPRGLANGEVEFTPRSTGETEAIALGAVVDRMRQAIDAIQP